MNEIEDRAALRYAGMMGHEYVIIASTGSERRVRAELNTIEDARRVVAENAEDKPAIYRRTGKTWRRTA